MSRQIGRAPAAAARATTGKKAPRAPDPAPAPADLGGLDLSSMAMRDVRRLGLAPGTKPEPPPIARSRAERDAAARAALAADMAAASGKAPATVPTTWASPGSWAMDVPLTNGSVTVAGSLPPSPPARSMGARRGGRW